MSKFYIKKSKSFTRYLGEKDNVYEVFRHKHTLIKHGYRYVSKLDLSRTMFMKYINTL